MTDSTTVPAPEFREKPPLHPSHELPPKPPELLTQRELLYALDNSVPYPAELHPQVAAAMAANLTEMLYAYRRPEHVVWDPEVHNARPEPARPTPAEDAPHSSAYPHPEDTRDTAGDTSGDTRLDGVRFAYTASARRDQVRHAITEAFELLSRELHPAARSSGTEAATHEELITAAICTMPVTTVRVTWLDTAGTPDHQWAVTYQFTEPILLTYANQRRGAPPGSALTSTTGSQYVAALTAPYDHPEKESVCYLARSLHRAEPGKSVEAWSEGEDGHWRYALLPWFLARPTGWWPLEPDDGQELHAAGLLQNVGAYTWPRTHPLPFPVPPGTPVLITDTNIPPPPAGYPTPEPVARHARRAVPAV
ncbi:hypothetical protein ACFC09_15340 [Streptomyces sp. NPDC056161]|uniref:hypothetical protein n=1 Tax=Streptomyces sp. NPDC056161 TaxID=3345732 RepID=UPI0035D956C9